jgi:hypothetical protein
LIQNNVLIVQTGNWLHQLLSSTWFHVTNHNDSSNGQILERRVTPSINLLQNLQLKTKYKPSIKNKYLPLLNISFVLLSTFISDIINLYSPHIHN